MNIRAYLPSARLMLMVGSVALSLGLIYAARAYTMPKTYASPSSVTTSSAAAADDSNWEAALYAIEAQNGTATKQPPSQEQVNTLLSAAQTSNLTETVGRTLLVKLANAKSQGLGDDIPTQEQIIADMAAQIYANVPSTTMTPADLNVVPDTEAALTAWGNGVIKAFADHPGADQNAAFLALGNAIDTNDESVLAPLSHISEEYRGIGQQIAKLPVPQTMAPFAATTINDLNRVSQTFPDMQKMITDPLRGLAGFQEYSTKIHELNRVFTQIAGALKKDGILFTKDEPGSAWSRFLSP